MKKVLSLILAALLTLALLTACGGPVSDRDGGIQIVTTIFPEYDWVMNILGSNPAGADVTMLLDTGVDLHSFQPTAEDILKISTCDLFIYVGGESDEWVGDALREVANQNRIVLNLLDTLGDAVKEEEVVEGMQEEEHEHDEDEEHEDHDEEDHEEHEHDGEETEYDEHVWLSLRNAAALVKSIAEALCQIDPQNADAYRSSAAAYIEKLNALDREYQSTVAGGRFSTLLFGDRFPFRYMVDDYGLGYYAAFVGCSAETEASFETVTFLAQKTDELALPAVMTIEGTDRRIAETVVQNTKTKDQKILSMDSMQSVTAKDVENGASYLSIMEQNLAVLKEALQ